MRVEAQPKNAAYSIVSSHRTVYPEGVKSVTQNLLRDGFQTGAFDRLASQNQELIARYFGTSLSAQKATGGLASTTARLRIVTALKSLREGLPQDIRQKYEDKEALKLKEAPSVRKGWHHKPETVKILKRKAKERATPGYRKKQSLTTKGFMTQEVRDKIKLSQLQGMTEERKKRISRTKKARRQQGHRMTRLEATKAALKRWGRDDLDPEKRRKDPLLGAMFNLDYVLSQEFPQEIRDYFTKNPKVKYEWSFPLADIRRLPYIRYQDGILWYVEINPQGIEIKKPLTEQILIKDTENARNFGRLPKENIRAALELRIRSTSLFSQSPDTTLFQAKP